MESAEAGGIDNTSFFGLKEFASGQDPVVDIVAIHGLDGHREQSWTAKNNNLWLRDFLPKTLPNARIFTYGYDAYTRGRQQLTKQSIYDHAVTLVSRLALQRQLTGTEHRPIIFVAHSVGGIVLKDALIHANAAHREHNFHHKAVELSTHGILFLGTPHQGSDAFDVAGLILRIESVFFPRETDDAVLKDLPLFSEALQRQLSEFRSISGRYQTKFFFELLPTEFNGKSEILVPKYSAVVPGTVDAEPIALHKNHESIAQFDNEGDEDFKTVAAHLFLMTRAAPSEIAERWRLYQ